MGAEREPAPSVACAADTGGPLAIELDGVEYEVGGRRILRDVRLDVRSGEILAIMGVSGSGKTTLLKCIGGLIKPSAGRVIIDGRDIAPLHEPELQPIRVRIGFVFQYAALFDSLTVYENVAFGLQYGRHMPRADVETAVRRRLDEVGMADTERLMPAQLSGGMQKRVGLARALATDPSIVLYDEPTSGLDPVMARTINELIAETRARWRMTSVVVSHDVASVFRLADRVAMIHEGAIIACGTPDDLRASTEQAVRDFIDSA